MVLLGRPLKQKIETSGHKPVCFQRRLEQQVMLNASSYEWQCQRADSEVDRSLLSGIQLCHMCVVNVIVNHGSHTVWQSYFVDTRCLSVLCLFSELHCLFSPSTQFFILQLCLTGGQCQILLVSHSNFFFPSYLMLRL